MRVVGSSDWTDAIPFDNPRVVADVAPGEPSRCATCGAESEPRSREDLWLVKHRHPKHHAGFVRFYCREHVPAPPQRPVQAAAGRAPAERRLPAKRPVVPERIRAMCPSCFIEVASDGVCGMCGESVA